MENTTAILLVDDQEQWQQQFARYARLRKRANACIGYFIGGPLAIAALFLAGRVLPLVHGDIAPGHPRYLDYLAGIEIGVVVFAIFLALYCGASIAYGRWLRKNHVMLGFRPDGSFAEVRSGTYQ